jgi:hypothetical protein
LIQLLLLLLLPLYCWRYGSVLNNLAMKHEVPTYQALKWPAKAQRVAACCTGVVCQHSLMQFGEFQLNAVLRGTYL